MPSPKSNYDGVNLDETAIRYLNSKRPQTARIYGINLRLFTIFYGKPIGEYINEIEHQAKGNEGKPLTERTRPGEDTARKFLAWLIETQGYANKTALLAMCAIQNYLKYYGLSMSWNFIELPANRPEPKNDNKHPWTLDEMRQLVDGLEYIRDKAMVLTAFQTGLGIGDLVNLNYGDIRRDYEARITPIMIELYRKKTEVKFRTFLGRDAASMIREYLKSRKNLRPDSPLFTMLGSERRVTVHALQKQLRVAAPKLSFILDTSDLNNGENGWSPARPHSLRSGFRSRLTGKMDGLLIEFFMGHHISEEKRAYLNMPMEELREIYASYEHLLSIEKTSKQEAEEKANIAKVPESVASDIESLKQSVVTLTMRNTELETRADKLTKALEDRLSRIERILGGKANGTETTKT